MEEDLIYQYYDPSTLLVINAKGVIRTVHTPFRVLCVQTIDPIPLNAWVYVEEVHSGANSELYFLIYGRQLPHSYFRLPLQF
jgi:hypothetical protein